MKLAYVLGEFPSLSETFILREIIELRRRGFEITVCSLQRPADGVMHEEARGLLSSVCYRPAPFGIKAIGALALVLLQHPVRAMRAIGQTVAATWRDPLTLLRCLRHVPVAAAFVRHATRFGATHVHAHFASVPADVGRLMAGTMGVSFSFSAHAADIYLQAPHLLDRKIRAACFVAVCTRYGAEEIGRRLGILPASIHVLPHGVPLPPIETLPRPGAEPTKPPLIVSVGRLQPKKGFAILIEACRLLRERGLSFRCVIVGDGPERSAIEAGIARHGLGPFVQLAGRRTQAEVSDLLRQARVFVLACVIAPDGDRDSLPNAILEAMAAGVPVVATSTAGIPEAVEDGRTGLLAPPGDAAALSDRIEELLKNAALCRTIGISGRACAAERFDIERNVAPLATLFERTREAV